jgi:hypothetical protein
MSLPSGTRLGTYEIVTPIGSGGFEQALEDRDPKLHLIGIDPDWEILHRERRFKDILHRLRLPMVATR